MKLSATARQEPQSRRVAAALALVVGVSALWVGWAAVSRDLKSAVPAAEAEHAGAFRYADSAAWDSCVDKLGRRVCWNQPTAIYVSPQGSDHNPGTLLRPLQTLAAAQQAVRKINRSMVTNISVYLETGTYRLAQPLTLGSQDSGTNGFQVLWRAAPRATPIISGAVRVTGWHVSDLAKNIWVASVPASLQTRQIYVNGMRAFMTSGAAPAGMTKTATGYRVSSPFMAHWRNPNEIEFVYTGEMGLMAEPICPIASISGPIITMAEPCWRNTAKRTLNWVSFGSVRPPTGVLNAYELLTHPGEFYLDNHAHRLYYIPRAGQNMTTADVEAPTLQTLVEGSGTAAHPIHDVSFQGIQFSYATWLQPSTTEGFSEVQAGYTITGASGYDREGLCKLSPEGTCPYGAWTKEPGNVQFRYDRNLTFRNDVFIHLGAAGLNLDDGSQSATVQGCVFTDISGNGIEIGNVDQPSATGPNQTTRIDVSDNHIYGLPVEFHGGVGVLVGYAADTTITHNQLDHLAYMAISMGWGGWTDKFGQPPVSNFSHDNTISDNLIYDVMEVMIDGGGIYTQGVTGSSYSDGEHVNGNVIHDMLQWGAALHSDNGASFITYTRNVLYNNAAYDWNSPHTDFATHAYAYDPNVIEHNYWQQAWSGPTTGGMLVKDNMLIAGSADAPRSIVANAGIEAPFRSILGWSGDRTVPNPPERVIAFGGNRRAYVSWRPSYANGNSVVTSYTLVCSNGSVRTITASRLTRTGYVLVAGLTNGKRYSFQVTATNEVGSSTASQPSNSIIPRVDVRRPAKPTSITMHTGAGFASTYWYPPTTGDWPILGYRVELYGRPVLTIQGLSEFLMASTWCRSAHVFIGLRPGQVYRIAVRVITPDGIGPAIRSQSFTA